MYVSGGRIVWLRKLCACALNVMRALPCVTTNNIYIYIYIGPVNKFIFGKVLLVPMNFFQNWFTIVCLKARISKILRERERPAT